MSAMFVIGLNSSFIILCIERLVCVLRISNYEESSRPALVSAIVLITTALFSIVLIFLCIPGVDWDEKLAVTTIRNSNNIASFQIMLIYMFALECVGVIFFSFLHFWSQLYRERIRGAKITKTNCNLLFIKTNASLSIKLQIEETIEMTRLFLPVVSVNCALNILTYLAALISNEIWPIHSIPTDFQMVLYELAFVSRLSPFFTSLLLARGTGQLRRLLCCTATEQRIKVILNSNKDQDDHFKRLKQMFETGAMTKTKNKH
ncbi:hypothetical protein Ddc_17893 [Ditylenchus destructor]|nr:hypothetical protein Ddc_17893 [Ditylenchus destructor]